MKKLWLIGLATMLGGPAWTADLWNQQAGLGTKFSEFPDQEFDDGLFDGFTTYMANDVVVGPGGWLVDSISVEVGASQPTLFASLTLARLNVFVNPGGATTPESTDNPTTGRAVTVSVSPVAGLSGTFLVTATGLNLSLGTGEYWIDLTPIGGVAQFGESLEAYTPINSAGALQGTAAINPGGSYSFKTGTGWDTLQHENSTVGPLYGGIDIQGAAVPEPLTVTLLAGAAACLLKRRRS